MLIIINTWLSSEHHNMNIKTDDNDIVGDKIIDLNVQEKYVSTITGIIFYLAVNISPSPPENSFFKIVFSHVVLTKMFIAVLTLI